MLPGKKYTPEDIVGIFVRRKWLILAPFAVGLALAPLLAGVVPEKYRSETLILVVPQRVPSNYVKPTVTETVANRLPAISEQILSRSRLERIINELDLYKEERQRTVMEDVVRQMRESDIDLGLAASGTADEDEIDSFRISFISDSPAVAQKVTERLASMTIEQNTRDREQQAESTNLFLEKQLADAKQRLLEKEEKLEEYKRQHAGQLPTQLQGNLHAISSAQLQLQSVSESANRARERRLLIERSIADAEALPPVQTPTIAASPETTVMSAAQQLQIAQSRLEASRARFTPDHPDVKALERMIADLKVKVAEEGSGPQRTPERTLSAAELAHQKRILDLKAELEVVNVQLAAHAAEEKQLKQRIAEYQSKVDVLPTRESELVELTRDYETFDEGYRDLLAKLGDAKIAANLERGQIGEQFRIVDPASLPERPYNQRDRMMVTASGAVVGLALGLLVVGFLEYRDGTFTRGEDIAAALGLPVLAMVPAVTSERERQVHRRKSLAVNAAGTALLLASVVIVLIWRP